MSLSQEAQDFIGGAMAVLVTVGGILFLLLLCIAIPTSISERHKTRRMELITQAAQNGVEIRLKADLDVDPIHFNID